MRWTFDQARSPSWLDVSPDQESFMVGRFIRSGVLRALEVSPDHESFMVGSFTRS